MTQLIRAARIRSLVLLAFACIVLMSPAPAAQAAITYQLSTQGDTNKDLGYGHRKLRKHFRYGSKHHRPARNQFRIGNHHKSVHGKKLFVDRHGREKKSFSDSATQFGNQRPSHRRLHRSSHRFTYRPTGRRYNRSPIYTPQHPRVAGKSAAHRGRQYGG